MHPISTTFQSVTLPVNRKSKIENRKSLLCALTLLFAAASSLALADGPAWLLSTADLKDPRKITVNEWSLKDGLSLTSESSKLERLSTREIVSLASTTKPLAIPTKGGTWQLLLRNGDLLLGSPTGMTDNTLHFKTTELDQIDIPLRLLAALQTTDSTTPRPAAPADKDTVRLKNGDTLDGVFLALDDSKLQLQNDQGTIDIELTRIDRLSLGGAVPLRAIPPLSARFTFLSGSVLTASSFAWTLNELTLTDPAGKERKTSTDQLASVDILGGRVVLLTQIDPTAEEQTPTFTTAWPMQRNKNVAGGPLKIANITYDRGLGVHTKSALTYTLDGSFTNLSLRVGLDDSAAPYGAANLAILLDGKVLWQQKNAKPGQLSPPLNLTITDGRQLQLLATPADAPNNHLDVQGRVNWLNPALTRP